MATAKKDSKITLFNPTQMPVVYSDDGRVLGGGERIEIDRLDETGAEVVKQGYLVDETERKTGAAKADMPKDGAPDQERTA